VGQQPGLADSPGVCGGDRAAGGVGGGFVGAAGAVGGHAAAPEEIPFGGFAAGPQAGAVAGRTVHRRRRGQGDLVMAGYVPRRGDLVRLRFSPQAGHEQAGHRPALVISPESYNRLTGLALFCPITSKRKGYAFEVAVEAGDVNGVVLSDQLRSLDWRQRGAKFIAPAPPEIMAEVTGKLLALLEDAD
jgi:mRNA interferase MazF